MKPRASVIKGEDKKEKTKRIEGIKEIFIDKTDKLIKMGPQNQVVAKKNLAPLLVVYLKKVEVDEGDYGVNKIVEVRTWYFKYQV